MNLFTFLTFRGNILACLDPDPQTQLNPDLIRSRNTDCFCHFASIKKKWASSWIPIFSAYLPLQTTHSPPHSPHPSAFPITSFHSYKFSTLPFGAPLIHLKDSGTQVSYLVTNWRNLSTQQHKQCPNADFPASTHHTLFQSLLATSSPSSFSPFTSTKLPHPLLPHLTYPFLWVRYAADDSASALKS
jgi:hypothetical protein